jgi:hypothetical protein
MSGTIETTNNNIITKINSVQELLDIFKQNNISVEKKNYDDIDEIKDEYEMGSINILSNYFLISNNYRQTADSTEKHDISREKNAYFSKYQSFIRKENFLSKLDRIMNTIKKNMINRDLDKNILQNIYNIIKTYNNSTINNNIREVVYEICNCESKMDIDANTSTLICKKCGLTKELYGTVFEDEQFYYQEGQRTKHGTYDPSKHCRFWVERIQARETTEIPDSVIKSVKQCIIRDKIKNKNQITCNQIRTYLRTSHNSKYNEHVPLIRKLITGISPPQLTDYEMQLIHIYFDKVIHIFDEIKPPEKTNCPYHPYFIYKIIEQILTKGVDVMRKLKILACIHLQSRETLVDNDRLWAPICSRIEEFTYVPTDRNEQYTEF